MFIIILFFFFSSRRRHTRYIGDWSSDVCSSDLGRPLEKPAAIDQYVHGLIDRRGFLERAARFVAGGVTRSEERRVGKECRYRGARGDVKNRERLRVQYDRIENEEYTQSRHVYAK